MLYKMTNGFQSYDWGSATYIQNYLNISEKIIAEIWMGAHPDLPSHIDGQALGSAISDRPEELLGEILYTKLF